MLKNLIPPFLYSAYVESRRKYGYFGEYKSWQEAKSKCSGYQSDTVIEKVKDSALKVKNGEAAYERDSVVFDKISYSWPLVSILLWIASKKNGSLNVLDFGGALGTSYFQNKSFLSHLKLNWAIVEQEKFVTYGKKFFEEERLHFYKNIEEYYSDQKPDIVLISSTLQYLENPYQQLSSIIDTLNPDHIFFDTTPFFEVKEDVIAIQKVPPQIYDASYPVWIFSRNKFLSFFKNQNYKLVTDFNKQTVDIFKIKGKPVDLMGMLFSK